MASLPDSIIKAIYDLIKITIKRHRRNPRSKTISKNKHYNDFCSIYLSSACVRAKLISNTSISKFP